MSPMCFAPDAAQAVPQRPALWRASRLFQPEGTPSRMALAQYVARPPDASNTPAVVKEHSSLASQAITAAISSTVPKRPIGIFESMKSMCCCDIWSKIAVRTAAGVIAFTVMLDCASSLPSDLVKRMTAALEALYAEAFGLPSLPATEATLTMRPQLPDSMYGTIARLQGNNPFRFTSITCRHCSTGYAASGTFGPVIPALATSTSMPPPRCPADVSAAASTRGQSATSTLTPDALAPSSLVARSSASWLMSQRLTAPPSVTKRLANARPMPAAPPVITARRPAKRWA